MFRYYIPLLLFLASCGSVPDRLAFNSDTVGHNIWDSLLKIHVDDDGTVDYKGFIKDSAFLNNYLKQISQHHPNDHNWTEEEQIAYWINAYNAYTVQLIIRHYPVASIKDIKNGIPFVNTVWDIKFIEIEGQPYDLNNLEHGILRDQFNEPRIHFALNCASVSCPVLRNEAYVAELLDKQLDDQARNFVNDQNIVTENSARLSKIFDWYAGDFDEPIRDVINRYAETPMNENAKISYLEYDWGLND